MDIPYRQYRMLRRMDRGLRRSDRHLAAMLAIFTRLYASEPVVSAEQARHTGVLAVMIWLVGAVTRLAAGVAWAIGRVAAACSALRRRMRGEPRPNAPVT
jgi:hypothetical protein